MKTIHEWLNELPDKEREKAFRYEKPAWDCDAKSIAEALRRAFVWPPREFEYWYNISNRYK